MISTIVFESLELASSEFSLDALILNRIRKAIYLVDSLAIGMQTSAGLRQAILHSLSTDTFAETIQRFLGLPLSDMPPESSHDSCDSCPVLTLQAKTDFSRSLCALFIKTAMYTSQDDIGLDCSVMTTLLDKYTQILKSTNIECKSYRSRAVTGSSERMPPIAERSLSTVELSSADWRESLFKNLSTAAQHQHQYIVKIVSAICQDLEVRCDSVERPLREAKEMCNDLKLKLNSTEATFATVENEAEKRLSLFNSLEAENHRLVEQVDAAEQRLEVLSTAHEHLTYRLECANRDALKFTESAREKEEQEKLAHLAIVTGKDEIYEMQALELAEAQARMKSWQDEFAQKTAASEEIITRLEDSMNSTKKELESSKLLADFREVEISRLLEGEAKMIVDKQVLESKVFRDLINHSQYNDIEAS